MKWTERKYFFHSFKHDQGNNYTRIESSEFLLDELRTENSEFRSFTIRNKMWA
jgi:hypothetical protein